MKNFFGRPTHTSGAGNPRTQIFETFHFYAKTVEPKVAKYNTLPHQGCHNMHRAPHPHAWSLKAQNVVHT